MPTAPLTDHPFTIEADGDVVIPGTHGNPIGWVETSQTGTGFDAYGYGFGRPEDDRVASAVASREEAVAHLIREWFNS